MLLPFLPPSASAHHRCNREALQESTARWQIWAFGFCPLGFSICLVPSIFLSLCRLLLKSSFYSVNRRQTFGLHHLPSPHEHQHRCLSPLPCACFTFPTSSFHQMHDCSVFTSGFICFIQLFPDCFHHHFLGSPFLFLPSAASLSSNITIFIVENSTLIQWKLFQLLNWDVFFQVSYHCVIGSVTSGWTVSIWELWSNTYHPKVQSCSISFL